VVSNLINVPGIVSLTAKSEDRELMLVFNADTITVDEIIELITAGGDQVTRWETY